ncbi:hypothetical protein RQP46_001784 [Phenoliferia psychrophenolica]
MATTFASLNEDVLRSIADHLDLDEVRSLGRVSQGIRESLAPLLWREVTFGGNPRKPGHAAAIWTLSTKPHILKHARNVYLGRTYPDAIPAIVACIQASLRIQSDRSMNTITNFYHVGSSPVPPVIADALCNVPTLSALSFPVFGAESLASFASCHSLTSIEINCSRFMSLDTDMLPHAPVTVARERRIQEAQDEGHEDEGPTIDENVDALVDVLSEIMIASKSTLRVLHLESWESGDWLDKLLRAFDRRGAAGIEFPSLTEARIGTTKSVSVTQGGGAIGTSAFPRWLASVPAVKFLLLSHVDASPPSGPPKPLTHLKTLIFVVEPVCDVTEATRSFWRGSVLDDLRLDGVHLNHLYPIFTTPPNAAALSKLFLRVHSPFITDPLKRIFKVCVNISELSLFATGWCCEMSDILKEVVSGAPNLTFLECDHPWEKPRNQSFPTPDGRSIRTDKFPDFKILSVGPGQSIASVILSRIHEDIAAVKPVYVQRFTDLARRLPRLKTVIWKATIEVTWTWTFTRTENGGLKFRQKPVVTFRGDPSEHRPLQDGVVLMRIPRGDQDDDG